MIGGKLAARFTVAAILMALALAVGAATAAIVAPAQDIDTTGWFGVDALTRLPATTSGCSASSPSTP